MSANEASLKLSVRQVIVCDDIRVEISGKSIFIGVYTDDIVAAMLPANLNLAFWCELDTTGEGESEFKIRIILEPDKTEIFQMGATIVSEADTERGNFSFGGVGLQVEREGLLSIQFCSDGSPWQEVERKRVLDGRKLSMAKARQRSRPHAPQN